MVFYMEYFPELVKEELLTYKETFQLKQQNIKCKLSIYVESFKYIFHSICSIFPCQ